jgi:NAD(P)-dependent dehydrogenase (short-subunit alcohol dehydrogenase family)
MTSKQQVALVVGASRGIGRQVAIDLAREGYAGEHYYHIRDALLMIMLVVVAAKSTSDANATKPFPPDPNSPQSTISTVEREIKEAGGNATAIAVDTRDFESVQKLVDDTVKVRL